MAVTRWVLKLFLLLSVCSTFYVLDIETLTLPSLSAFFDPPTTSPDISSAFPSASPSTSTHDLATPLAKEEEREEEESEVEGSEDELGDKTTDSSGAEEDVNEPVPSPSPSPSASSSASLVPSPSPSALPSSTTTPSSSPATAPAGDDAPLGKNESGTLSSTLGLVHGAAYEFLSPEDQKRILAKWSNLSAEATTILADMLATRNNKTQRMMKATKTAVVTVNSVDYRLGPVLLNFRRGLPHDWAIQIFYSSEIADWLLTVKEVGQVGASLHQIVPTNLTYTGYSDFVRSRIFWDTIAGDHVLLFQTDTALCLSSPFKIQDFMDFAYIGAPWGHAPSNCGNGGLSFRNKPVMLKALKECAGAPGMQEDGWFCQCLDSMQYHGTPVNRPTFEIGKCFSVETALSEAPLGVHGPGKYWANLQADFFAFCPEAELARSAMKTIPPTPLPAR